MFKMMTTLKTDYPIITIKINGNKNCLKNKINNNNA